jgi:glycosyltransferase involved in cell wall biosynthesis
MPDDLPGKSEFRLLHVASQMSWRGGEQQLAYLIENLSHKNIEQRVFCHEKSAIATYCRKHNIPLISYSNSLFARIKLRNICKGFNIDIIHAHDSKAHSLAFVSSVLFGLRKPIVVSRRVDFPVKANLFSKWKYNNPFIKKYICVSKAIKEILSLSLKDKSKVEVVYSGIKPERFSQPCSGNYLRKEFSIHEDQYIIGNVAALADHKDYYTFLNTAINLLNAGMKATFLVIGEGSLMEEIKNYCYQLGLKDDVVFTGFRKDIPQLLPCFDLFLFTSKTEGLGTSILDAMACQIPIVATRAGGVTEILLDKEHALLCPVGDTDCLASSVQKLLADEELQKKLVNQASKQLRLFTMEKTAENSLEIYRDIL